MNKYSELLRKSMIWQIRLSKTVSLTLNYIKNTRLREVCVILVEEVY